MTDITITRWTNYGHRRGYAAAADGAKLGWIDLKTGAVTVEDGADALAVTGALEAWGAMQADAPAVIGVAPTAPPIPPPASAPVLVVAPASEPSPALAPTPEPTWTDLAAHRPGQLVREQAAVAWESSKERSKVLAYGARIFNVHTDERAWRVGADGEEAVGARLEKLRDRGWYLLHSVPVGKKDSDIDHVAIGPGGVFTLNTKNHPGGKIWVAKYQMRVNGHVVPYLRNASHEATRASKLLTKVAGFDVSVRSCVVVLTGTIVPEVKIKQMPDDVMVLDRMDVPRWFKKRPPVLTPEQVDVIYAVARRSDTWV
jgi:hypothetical protein